MTRINVGIEPREIPSKQLLAEHREIKRIPNCVASGKYKPVNIPETFRLGTGHVKFFVNKLNYLLKRYKKIYTECVQRGYNVTDYSEAWNGVPDNLMQDYQPSQQDRELLLERFRERNIILLERK